MTDFYAPAVDPMTSARAKADQAIRLAKIATYREKITEARRNLARTNDPYLQSVCRADITYFVGIIYGLEHADEQLI